MYTTQTLHPDLVDRLTELEGELGVPIRAVFAGRAVGPWDAYEHEDHESADGGLTLHLWPHRTSRARRGQDFGGYYLEDIIVPDEDPLVAVRLDGELVGSIDERLVTCYLPIWNLMNEPTEEVSTLHETLIAALRCSCDPEIAERADEARREQERQALLTFVTRTYTQKLTEARERIDDRQLRVAEQQRSIANHIRTIREEQASLDALLLVSQQQDIPEQLLREWELIQQNPRIALAEFTNGAFVLVTTDDLRLYNEDGESRWLGRFQIRVDLAELDVHLTNLDTPRGGRDHPHVVSNRPCFGGHDDALYELLGKGEFYTAVDMILQYLETFNRYDEYGRYGSYWFDVEDERPLTEEVAA